MTAIRRATIWLALLLAACGGSAGAAAEDWDHETAVVRLAEDPERALAMLGRGTKPHERLDYALALHAFAPASPDRDETIRALLLPINDAALAAGDEFAVEVIGRPDTYDGTDDSLLRTIQLASATGVAQTASSFYAVPCPILAKRRALLGAVGAAFGSSRDNHQPRSGCEWGRGDVPGFPQKEVLEFVEASERATMGYLAGGGGSIRHGRWASVMAGIADMKLWLPEPPAGEDASPEDRGRVERPAAWPVSPAGRPYETWSYLALANRGIAAGIGDKYDRAEKALAAFYAERAGIPPAQAADAARLQLLGRHRLVVGADCGGAPPPPSFRRLVMDGAPLGEVEAFAAGTSWRDPEHLAPFRACAEESSDHDPPEPLALAASRSPDLFAFLMRLAEGLAPEERRALDLEVAVEQRTRYGKTPLMAAAQHDYLDGARWLIAQGADVKADLGDYPLEHGRRTALHYAAASGSLGMVGLLVESGADKAATDSKGLTPLDYLEGRGPVPANPRMTAEERARAADLLR
ncbi:MAG TPA: ankyrin repeat domain-containing protein [Azospirillaceae bacterium]|nr:ankyrin repeat domain-containing protein [Azospirillaceae bacterium]